MSYWNNVTKVKNGMVTERLDSSFDAEGAISEVIERLKLEEQHHSVDYSNLRLSMESRDWEDGESLSLLGDRPATPEEIAAQSKEDAQDAAQRKEWDLKQLETLQKKYGQFKQDCK